MIAGELAERARAMARKGYVEDAFDLLAQEIREAELELTLEFDEREQVWLSCAYDAQLVECLRHIPGTRRDKEAAVWLVPGRRLVDLIDLLERLSWPPCAPGRCWLDGGRAPSQAHQEAHASFCL